MEYLWIYLIVLQIIKFCPLQFLSPPLNVVSYVPEQDFSPFPFFFNKCPHFFKKLDSEESFLFFLFQKNIFDLTQV